MVAYTRHEFYAEVWQYIYLLYLIPPEVATHDYLCKQRNIFLSEFLCHASGNDDEVGGVS